MNPRPLALAAVLLLAGCGASPAARPPASAAYRYNGEGLRRLERGDLKGAGEMFHDALREAELVDDLGGQAEAWNNLGALASARGEPREAWAYHAGALRFYQLRGGAEPGQIRAHSNLGGAMLLAGSVDEAASQFRAAAALAGQLREPAAAAMARVGLAAVALRRGDPGGAAALAHAEADEARRRGNDGVLAAALSIEGASLELLDRHADARARHEEALALDRKREHPGAVRDDLRALARLAERQGDRGAAAAYLTRAARVSRRMEDLDVSEAELKRAIELGGEGPETRALQGELEALQASKRKPLSSGKQASLGAVMKRLGPGFLVFVVTLLGLLPDAWAHPSILGKGQERAVLALFAPYTLGGEVSGGFRLWDIAIESKEIRVGLKGPGERSGRLELVHPEERGLPREAPRSAHFAVRRGDSGDVEARAAEDALIEALKRNDRESLWADPPALEVVENKPLARATVLLNRWNRLDGLLILAVVLVLGVGLATRLLVRESWWMTAALGGILVAGGLWRLALAPASFLGAWPWSRLWPSVSSITEGDGLAWVTARTGQLALTDVISWTHLAYAVLMPLVLFSHASFLLRDARMGLLAAFAVAFLPQHIRFSRAEDAFIPSLVLTSLAFAAIHAWLRDPSRPVRVAALLSLPLSLYMGYQLRPLNLAFLLVYLVAILVLHPENAPRHRRLIGAAAVVGMALVVLPTYLQSNGEVIGSVLSRPTWLLGVPLVILWPPHLVLTDPRITPPVLVIFAVLAGKLLWRTRERRVLLFLLGWLLLFVTLHAVVTQTTLQPRYHMHLVVPFLLLAAMGAVHFWDRSDPVKRRWWAAAALAMMGVSPVLHAGFIRDLSHAEQQEHAFVMEAKALVPEGCTVIEYAGADPEAKDLRFVRAGERVGGRRTWRYQVIPVFEAGVRARDPKAPSLEATLQEPPSCLYVYEGLACMSSRDPRACTALRERLEIDEIARRQVPLKIYDESNVHQERRGEPTVTLLLARVRGTRGPR